MEYWQSSPCKICSAWVFFVALDIFLGVTRGTSQDEINKHLMMGGEMLARGNLQDALSHFHAAVEGDPKNYLTYFKRGTVYLAMAKAKFAILDLNKVLELKPDFTGARYQRAQVLLKQGNLKAAKEDFLYIYQLENNGDAYSNYIKAENLQSDIATAEAYIRENDYVSAVNLLTSIIEACPWSSYLRELRSQCYVALNEPVSAILDLRSTTKLQSDNTDGLYKLAILYYQLGQAPESLREVRECLKLDPEHKDCFPHYKKVKKVAKFMIDAQEAAERKDYDTCISSASKILKTETKVPMIKFAANTRLCSCYLHDGRYGPSIDACTDALNINRDPEVLCDRAEAYTENEMYDEALRDYYEVVDGNGNYHQRAKEGIQKVQKLQKQSEKRDYYKILGVKRSATKREIIKAYRKAAQQWHPDNFPEGAEKKAAEKKFIDIAAAKEVLTNEDKRAKFDQGEDPLDPESGNHQGFNPFQEFHHFHSGTPFTFKFHFN